MAKKAEVIITCDGSQVKRVLEEIDRRIKELTANRQALNQKVQQGVQLTRQEIAQDKKWEQEIKALTSAQQKNRAEYQRTRDVMKDLANAKVKDMKRALGDLQKMLNNVSANSPKRAEVIRKSMDRVQKKIQEVTGATGKFGTTHNAVWQTAVRNITAYMGVFAAFNMAKTKLTDMVKKNYELSDAIMNVRKVSGLTVEDINQLYANISKIDTRNTVNTLMNLAYQGGKLGIGNYGVEGLTGFVKAAEQVQMALGEDLGEEALPALAKLTENMGLIKDMGVEQAMQKTASAMFTLSTTSVSTGQGIVEFSKRLMPVAKSAGVTTDQLLGLASATESSGLAAEVAATAFVKMFPSIYKNSDALEKYLGLQKGFIRESYEQGKAMDVMVAIFDKMQQMGNINKYPELFKLLGSEGARMNTVMTAMANNVDMLRDHLNTSNIAFKEGTAVINEYMLQNNSAAGILERANNIWEKAFVNPEGVDMVKELAQEWYNLSKELTESETWMTSIKRTLMLIAGAVEVLIKLLPTLIKALMFYGVAQTIRKVYLEFTMLNTAMTAAAGTAGKLSAFFKSNVWVLAATAIMFAASAIYDMATAESKAKKEADAMGDALKQASDEGERASARERAELKRLYDATQDQKKAIEERTKAALELKRKYPGYFADLTTEQILAGKAADAYHTLAQEILNAAKARAMEKKMEELAEQNMNLEDDNKKREKWRNDNQKKYNQEKSKIDRAVDQQNRMETSGASAVGGKWGYQHATNAGDKKLVGEYQTNEQRISDNSDKIKENTATMQRLSDEISKIKPKSTTVNPETFTPGSTTDDGGSGGGDGKKVPEWMTEEKKEAEKATKAVIGSIEEFYRLQEAAANELAANGQLEGKDFDMLIKHIHDRKDKMLLEARRAIVGDKNTWDDIKKSLDQDLVKRDSQVSLEAIKRIQDAEPGKQGAVLKKYNGSDAVFGLDSNAYLNDIRKNAAQNELNIQRRQAAIAQEIDKILLQYQFVEQAQRDFGDKLVTLGLVTDGYQKVVKQLADGTEITANTKEVTDFANKVVGLGSTLYGVNPNDPAQLQQLMWTVMTTTGENGMPVMEGFASIFPNFDKWMQQPNQYKDEMQAMYELMIQYEGIYYDKLKQRDDLQNKRLGSWWDHSDEKKENDKKMRDIQIYDFQYNTMKQGETMGYMMGLTNDVGQDPEVLREQAILEAKMAIWEKAKEEREAGLISEEVYQQKLHDMQDASMSYTEKIMQNIQKRIDRLHQFEKPVIDMAGNVGKKLGEMIAGAKEQSMSWEEIWKNMTLAVAESVIDMGAQYAQNLIMEKSMNAQSKTEAISKAEVDVAAGTASAASKTLGTLGWWGIALIPVIAALLKGLLQGALSTANSNSSASTEANVNRKLVSGMLTYDKGNVQRFIGQDGKVYTATEEAQPKDGLVTHPIATTVQGQPALVAENGPEIVIGRETTKAIMMNEPQLIKYLADYGKTGGFAGGWRPFDSGNVESVANDSQNTVSNESTEMQRTLNALTQTVALLQQQLAKGIKSSVNMYGTDGLYENMQKANKFMSKYQ